MSSFEKDRSRIIERKNEVYGKKEELKEKISEFDKHRAAVEEGISKIPKDLPQELQEQVDMAVENVRAELKGEADEIGKEADTVKEFADKAMDEADTIKGDLNKKAEKMMVLKDIPLVGSFAEKNAEKLSGYADQMADLRQETQKYQDELIQERNKLYQNR